MWYTGKGENSMKQKNGYISVKYGPNVAKFELDLYFNIINMHAKFELI